MLGQLSDLAPIFLPLLLALLIVGGVALLCILHHLPTNLCRFLILFAKFCHSFQNAFFHSFSTLRGDCICSSPIFERARHWVSCKIQEIHKRKTDVIIALTSSSVTPLKEHSSHCQMWSVSLISTGLHESTSQPRTTPTIETVQLENGATETISRFIPDTG